MNGRTESHALTDAQLEDRRKNAASIREALSDYDELEPCECDPPCMYAKERAKLAEVEREIADEERRRGNAAR